MSDELGKGLCLETDEASHRILASNAPEKNAPPPPPLDMPWLIGKLAGLGAQGWRLFDAAIDDCLRKYNSGQAFSGLALAQCQDGEFSLHIAHDGMSATLEILPPQGGRPVDAAAVRAELTAKRLVGIDEQAVAALLAKGAGAAPIAHGTPPVQGNSAWFETLIDDARDREPKLNEEGLIDYREFGDFSVVHEGDALMRRHPADKGKPGLTVQGVAVAPAPVKDAAFAAGLSGAAIDLSDPDLLVAKVSGLPVKAKNGMNVEPVLSLKAVNLASGNVHFEGSVSIREDVASGMSITAAGDIDIGGSVECASLKADGDIRIRGGVIGSDHAAAAPAAEGAATAEIRCKGSFHAGYVQKAKVEAGDSIEIGSMAMASELAAGNRIRVGQGGKGKLIGGTARAQLSIEAQSLGADSHISTQCRVGPTPELLNHAEDLAAKKKELGGKLADLARIASALREQKKLSPEQDARLKGTVDAMRSEYDQIEAEEQQALQQIENAKEAKVIVGKEAFEGVEVFLGRQRFRLQNDSGRGQILLKGDSLEFVGH
jgi:uncharacterized protein (DUF342 family)